LRLATPRRRVKALVEVAGDRAPALQVTGVRDASVGRGFHLYPPAVGGAAGRAAPGIREICVICG